MISSQNVVYELNGLSSSDGGQHNNNGGASSPGTSSMLSNSSMTRVSTNIKENNELTKFIANALAL